MRNFKSLETIIRGMYTNYSPAKVDDSSVTKVDINKYFKDRFINPPYSKEKDKATQDDIDNYLRTRNLRAQTQLKIIDNP
jgi:hypothetical protein